MTATDLQASVCRFPNCDEPVHADGICLDHYEQFEGDAQPTVQPTRDATPAPTGRLRISPLHAVVRSHRDGSAIIAVYGVYGTGELAQAAASNLSGLGIPDKMQVVPFYEVTP